MDFFVVVFSLGSLNFNQWSFILRHNVSNLWKDATVFYFVVLNQSHIFQLLTTQRHKGNTHTHTQIVRTKLTNLTFTTLLIYSGRVNQHTNMAWPEHWPVCTYRVCSGWIMSYQNKLVTSDHCCQLHQWSHKYRQRTEILKVLKNGLIFCLVKYLRCH